MALPNFISVGVTKSGTTSLYYYLKEHPDIFLGPKEINFFQNTSSRKIANYEYEYFGDVREEKVIGDFSPEYINHPEVATRIQATLGKNTKIHMGFRHPVQRMYSDYKMQVKKFCENRSFAEAYKKMPSFYQMAKAYHDAFGSDQIYTMLYEEDYFDLSHKKIQGIFDFLEVDKNKIRDFDHHVFKGYLPRITFIPEGYQNLQVDGKQLVPPCEIAIVTVENSPDAKMLFKPSEHFKKELAVLGKNITMKLDPSYEAEVYKTQCHDDTKRLEDLIKRDLSVWYKNYGLS